MGLEPLTPLTTGLIYARARLIYGTQLILDARYLKSGSLNFLATFRNLMALLASLQFENDVGLELMTKPTAGLKYTLTRLIYLLTLYMVCGLYLARDVANLLLNFLETFEN